MSKLTCTVALLATLLCAPPVLAASSYVAYDFTADFNKLSPGAYQISQQQSLWTDWHIVSQRNRDLGPNLLSRVVATPDGNALQAVCPNGSIGADAGVAV